MGIEQGGIGLQGGLADGFKSGEGGGVVGLVVAGAVRLEQDDVLQPVKLVADGGQFGEVGGVFAEQDLRVGKGERVQQVWCRAGGVAAKGAAADQAGGHLCHHPIGAVLPENADMDRRGEAQLQQPGGKVANPGGIVCPGHAHPCVVALLEQRGRVRMAARVVQNQRR